jgi:hypothetical protein
VHPLLLKIGHILSVVHSDWQLAAPLELLEPPLQPAIINKPKKINRGSIILFKRIMHPQFHRNGKSV